MKQKVFISMFNQLGNQLYMYAFGISLQNKKKVNIIFETSFFKNHKWKLEINKIFDLKDFQHKNIINNKFIYLKYLSLMPSAFQKILIKIFSWGKITNFISEKNIDLEKWKLKHDKKFNNIYFEKVSDMTLFHGYWESKDYFSYLEKDLKENLIFKEKIIRAFQNKNKPIINDKCVVLHIRRLDKAELYKNNTTSRYYVNSIKYFKEKIKFPIFYIFSNDIEYSKKIIEECQNEIDFKYDFISFYDLTKYEQFYFMTLFKNFIIPQSTFSWWACYLSKTYQKRITLPKYWFKDKLIDSDRVLKGSVLIDI